MEYLGGLRVLSMNTTMNEDITLITGELLWEFPSFYITLRFKTKRLVSYSKIIYTKINTKGNY